MTALTDTNSRLSLFLQLDIFIAALMVLFEPCLVLTVTSLDSDLLYVHSGSIGYYTDFVPGSSQDEVRLMSDLTGSLQENQF